jgi:hypothetical protein
MLPKFFAVAVCAALPLLAVKQRVELITTDHADFAGGGLIHIEGSTGELNIAGWDRPSVEVIATRYAFGKLKPVEVVTMVAANGELTIATHRHESGVHVDYQIMVPRNSRLVIHHHIGDVVITDVGGDVDATNGAGDILIQLRDPEQYSIDAKTRLGAVYSDITDPRHHGVVGERLVSDGKTHRVNLRVGAGGISIQRLDLPAAGL